MTVAALVPAVEYLEDGASTHFPVPFRFNAPEHITARRINALDGLLTELVYGVDYSVTGGETDAGGTLVKTLPGPAGDALLIERRTPRSQATDYQTDDTFPAETHEAALDRAMLIDQEQDELLADFAERALLVPEGDEVPPVGPLGGYLEGDTLVVREGRLQWRARAAFAGRFFAGDATGGLIPSNGTGNDPALRADLADPLLGGKLVAFLQAGLGAVTQTAEAKMRERVSAKDYGCKGDGVTDDAPAIAKAVAAALTLGRGLRFPPGIYVSSQPFEFGQLYEVIGEGKVTLRYTGTGNYCVGVRAPDGSFAYGHTLKNFTIEGSGAPNQDGLRVDRHAHGHRENIRIRNVSRDGFALLGDVCTTYLNCMVSGNEGAFTTAPRAGLFLSDSPYGAGVTASTDLVFINFIAEWCRDYGILCQNSGSHTFIGGTCEAMRVAGGAQLGIMLNAASNDNSFYCMFCEANLGGDVQDFGKNNRFYGGTFNSAAPDPNPGDLYSFIVQPGASGTEVHNALIWQLWTKPASDNAKVVGCNVRREFKDEGNYTFIQDLLNPFATSGRHPGIRLGNRPCPDPKTLDWYEEGVFTPVVAGSSVAGTATYTAQIGLFQRIGNKVTYFIHVNYTGHTGTGTTWITGLPYASRTSALQFPASSVVSNLTYANNLAAWVESAQSRVVLLNQTTNASIAGLAVDAAATLHIAGEYVVGTGLFEDPPADPSGEPVWTPVRPHSADAPGPYNEN